MIVAVLAGLYLVIPQDVREQGRRPVPPPAARCPPLRRPTPRAARGPAPWGPPPAPPPMLPPSAGTVPSLPGYDYLVTVSEDKPRAGDGGGTAFALNATGIWLTAAHVVDNCR